jgi:hypothetical protein
MTILKTTKADPHYDRTFTGHERLNCSEPFKRGLNRAELELIGLSVNDRPAGNWRVVARRIDPRPWYKRFLGIK